MRVVRKAVSVVLSVLFAISVFPVSAFAAPLPLVGAYGDSVPIAAEPVNAAPVDAEYVAAELDPEPTPEVPEPSPEPYDGPVNAYTGEPVTAAVAAQRPFAFIINNHRDAQPQCGVGEADIIYETLVESGVTRMLAIYKDITDVGAIGTIRSARPYYLDLVRAHDAILVTAGASDEADTYMNEQSITRIDSTKGRYDAYFYRDEARRAAYGTEHSLFTSSTLIQQNLPSEADFRTAYDGYTEPVYEFSPLSAPDGELAGEITVSFSDYKPNGVFTYNASIGKYIVS